jgi:ubiquitin C-terminal hydrolase
MFGQSKITKAIRFPLQLTIPIGKKSAKINAKYDLTGVIVHFGSTTRSGHYIAFVKVIIFDMFF